MHEVTMGQQWWSKQSQSVIWVGLSVMFPMRFWVALMRVFFVKEEYRVSDVIDQIRGRVFYQDIQTPRSVLKNEAVGRVF